MGANQRRGATKTNSIWPLGNTVVKIDGPRRHLALKMLVDTQVPPYISGPFTKSELYVLRSAM